MSISPQSARGYRDRLLQQKRLLEHATLSTVKQGRTAVAEEALDAADQAALSYQKELLFTHSTRDHGQLGQVKSALARLKEGRFGECTLCGTQIGAKRLEAVPWTPYCIVCQERIERGEIAGTGRAA